MVVTMSLFSFAPHSMPDDALFAGGDQAL